TGLRQRNGEGKTRAEYRMDKTIRRHIPGRAAQCLVRIQHRAFHNHLQLLLDLTGLDSALDAASAREDGIVSAVPGDGVGMRGAEKREQPLTLKRLGRAVFGLRRRRNFRKDHVRKNALCEFRRLRSAPSARALAAETTIGEKPEGGLQLAAPP